MRHVNSAICLSICLTGQAASWVCLLSMTSDAIDQHYLSLAGR